LHVTPQNIRAIDGGSDREVQHPTREDIINQWLQTQRIKAQNRLHKP